MKRYRGIIAEFFSGRSNRGRLAEMMSVVALKAHADTEEGADEGDDSDVGDKDTHVNYEDLITKARSEEKAKQYKKIEKLKEQVKALEEQHNDDLVAKAALQKEIEKLKAQIDSTDESDTLKSLRAEVDTLTKDKEALQKQIDGTQSREDIEKEVREELEKEYEVKAHKAELLAQHPDLLVPELVGGDTVEELDKSLEAALARDKKIRKSLGLDDEDGGDDKDSKKSKKPKKDSEEEDGEDDFPVKQKRTPKSRTPKGAVGGSEYTTEDIANMDVSSSEYRELRKKLGLA